MNSLTRTGFFSKMSVFRSLHTTNFKKEIPFPDQALAGCFDRYKGSADSVNRSSTLDHPQTVARYWQVARCMQAKGLLALVHGQAASWSIPQQILAELGYTNCSTLRSFEEVAIKEADVIQDKVKKIVTTSKSDLRYWLLPKFASKIGRLDHNLELRTHLLATTIGLFHCEYHESPLTFVYPAAAHKYDRDLKGNLSVLSEGESQMLQNTLIIKALQKHGVGMSVIEHLIARITPLYSQASQLDSGQLLVIGVPYELCDKFVYHCKDFGYPTGLSIKSVVDKICNAKFAKHLPKQGCQARFIFCKESMQPESGVCVVNIMDKKACEAFTKDFNLPSIWDEAKTKDFLVKRTTESELLEEKQQLEFQTQLDSVIESIRALNV